MSLLLQSNGMKKEQSAHIQRAKGKVITTNSKAKHM